MSAGDEDDDDDESRMPLLVYVSREKRRASPHHFKAGALNALLRVSSLVSNAPFVLVLDCDMSCNSRPGGHVLPPRPPPLPAGAGQPRLRAVPADVPQPQPRRHLHQRPQIFIFTLLFLANSLAWERATSPAALGCPIECADGPDLVFSGHFA